MVPVITKAAASLPQMAAISRSKAEVVWSSTYTSSFRVARLIASSIPTEGVVITSPVILVRFYFFFLPTQISSRPDILPPPPRCNAKGIEVVMGGFVAYF